MSEIAEAFKRFKKTQSALRKFGAFDTEPDSVMQRYIANQLGFLDPISHDHLLPVSGKDWKLYTSSMNCEDAAKKLTTALIKLVEKLRKIYLENHNSKKEIKSFLWRVFG